MKSQQTIDWKEALKQSINAINPFIQAPTLKNLLVFSKYMHGYVDNKNFANDSSFQPGTTLGQYCLLCRLGHMYCGDCPLRCSQDSNYSRWCMSWYAKHWYGEEYWTYKKVNTDGRHLFPHRRSRITKQVLADFHTRAIHYKLAAEGWLADGKIVSEAVR